MRLTELAIFTADVPSTTAFYEELLGEPVVAEPSMALFSVGDVEVLVHETYDPDETDHELPPEDHPAYAVADLEDAVDRVVDAGGSVVQGPTDHEWGRSAYVRDPDGRLVELTTD